MKKTHKSLKAYKKAYNREWYLANKFYKDTYQRIAGRQKSATKRGLTETAEMYGNTNIVLVLDRATRVRKGRWIDQRTGGVYTGINLEDTSK